MKIVNVVATVKVNPILNLDGIHKALPDSSFSSSTGHWLRYRLKPENTYIAFYKSGKFLITGCKTKEQTEKVANRIISILRDGNIDTSIVSIDVHNIVIQDKITLSMSLEDYSIALDPYQAQYEPEQFPGIILKVFDVSVLIFGSGKFIVAGIKKEGDIAPVMERLKTILLSAMN